MLIDATKSLYPLESIEYFAAGVPVDPDIPAGCTTVMIQTNALAATLILANMADAIRLDAGIPLVMNINAVRGAVTAGNCTLYFFSGKP